MASIHKSQFVTEVKYEVDKASLAEVQKSLQSIQNAAIRQTNAGTITPELKTASEAAKELSNILNQSWNTKLNQLDLTKFNASIKASYGSIEQLRTKMVQGGEVGVNAFNNIARSVLSTNIALQKSNQWLDKMAITMSNTIRFGISSSIFNNFTGSIQKAYGYVQKLDKSLNDIRIVSDASAEDMSKFAKYANQAASAMGASTLDYTNAALIYYQQGLDEQQVKERSDITVKMANVLGTSASEVSDYMTAIWNNFDDGSKSLEYYADVLASLGAKTASSAEEISTGLEKFAAIGGTVGLSYEYAAAALTTVTDRTRQSAEVVGTAFKTLFARIQGLKLGETLDDGTTLNKYSEALQAVGISIKDQSGNLKDMDDILNEMGAKWGTLSKDQQVALAQTVAGVRQYTQLISLMDNWDFFQQNVEWAAESTGELNKQQEIYMDSLKAHFQQLETETQNLYDNLLDENAIKSFTDLLTGALKTINTYIKGLGTGLNPLLTLGANAAALFSNQIGGALATQSINKEIQQQNSANFIAQQDWVGKNIKNDNSASGQGLKEETEYYEKIKEIRQYLNDAELISSNNALKNIGVLKEEIVNIENWKEIASEASGQNIENIEQLNEALQAEVNWYKELNEAILNDKIALMEYNDEAQEGLDPDQREKYLKTFDKMREKINEPGENATEEEISEYKKVSKILDEIQDKIKKGQGLSTEEVNTLLAEQNKQLEKAKDNIYDLRGAAQGYEDSQGDVLVDKKNQLQQEESLILKLAEEKKLAQDYSDITRGIALTMSTLTSLGGIFDTWFGDNDLSTWDKIKSTLAVLMVQLPIIAKNWSTMTTWIPTATKYLQKYNVSLAAQNALTDAEIKGKTAEAGAEVTNTIAKKANNAETSKGIILRAKETIATVLQTAKLWLENIALAVKKLLMGDITTLGVIAAAAIAAGTVAIIKWIAELVHANSEEGKLQKRLKEQQEYLERVNEEYSNIKETLNNYQDARSKIDDLTEGTVEWYEAIQKANEEASKLISQWGLIAGKDYAIDVNGIITIKDNVIETQMFKEMQTTLRAQADVSRTQTTIQLNSLQKERQQIFKQFAKEVGKLNVSKNLTEDTVQSISKQILNNYVSGRKDAILDLSSTTWDPIKNLMVNQIESEQTNTENIIENADENTIALTDALGVYGSKLQANFAQEQNLKNQQTLKDFNAYATKEQIEYFQTLNGTAQKALLTRWNTFTEAQEEAEKARKNINLETKAAARMNDGSGIERYVAGTAAAQEAMKDELGDFWGTIYNISPLGAITNSMYGISAAKGNEDNLAKGADQAIANVEYQAREKTIQEQVAEDETRLKNREQWLKEQGYSDTSTKYVSGVYEALRAGTLTEEDLKLLTKEELSPIYAGIKFAPNPEYDNDSMQLVVDTYENTTLEDGERSNERRLADLQEYNDELRNQAKELDTTSTALDLYATAMKNANGEVNDHTRETAKSAAEEYKFNKSYNNAISTFEDNKDAFNAYVKALKKGDKVAYDVADGAGAIIDSLKEMKLTITAEDLKDDNVISQINKLLNGTEKEAEAAYEKLFELSQMNALKEFFGDNEANYEKYQTIIDGINNTKIDGNLTGAARDDLAAFLETANFTAEQIQELSNQLGVEIPITYEAPPDATVVDDQYTIKASTVKHTYSGYMPSGRVVDGEIETLPVNYSWYETTEDKTTDFLHFDATNFKVTQNKNNLSNNNYSKSLGNKNKNKGSGSSSKPKKVEHKDIEIDRYHKIDKQIEKVDKTLDKLQKDQDRLTGKSKFDNLTKQWQLLNQQAQNYNEKIKIAQGEQKELRNELTKQGVTFNSDGTVKNYVEIIRQKDAHLKSLQDQYNKLSAKQQEKWDEKKILQNAEEELSKLQKDLDRYDELTVNVIPELQTNKLEQELQKLETRIQQLNLEVDVKLKTAETERDWNAFRKRVIDQIQDDDILGNMRTTAADIATYIANNNSGQLDVDNAHLRYLLDHQNEFAADPVKYQEELDKAYKQVQDDLLAIQDLEEEMHQYNLDMLDEAQDKFDKQIDTYQQLGDMLEHDAKLVEMTLGDKAYEQLGQLFEKQHENNTQQLIFYRTQVDYWKQIRDGYKEGSDEWNNANEKMIEAMNNAESTLETVLQNTADAFKNSINQMFKAFNDGLTKGFGLDYANEQWDLINKNADTYLDTINQIQGINDLERKYLDAINKNSNPAAQQKLQKIMSEQLILLREKDRLTKSDLDMAQKRYDLYVAQIALEEAQRNKSTMYLRRDSRGNYRYQYAMDTEAYDKAKNDVDIARNALYNENKARAISDIENIQKTNEEMQQKLQKAMEDNDLDMIALLDEQYTQWLGENRTEFAQHLAELDEAIAEEWLAKTGEDFTTASAERQAEIRRQLIPQLEALSRYSVDGLTSDNLAQLFAQAREMVNANKNTINEDLANGGRTLEELQEGKNQDIETVTELLDKNQDLLDNYKAQIDATNDFVEAEIARVEALKAERDMVENATEAYEKLTNARNKEGADYAKALGLDTYSNTYGQEGMNTHDYEAIIEELKVLQNQELEKIAKAVYGSSAQEYIDLIKNNNSLSSNAITAGQVLRFASGGYTGDWAGTSRLAALDQKELILNATDTANMLNAVTVMRNLAYSLGETTLARLAGVAANNPGFKTDENGIVQDVHIDAQFPNVTNSREIEEAFNNLVNAASQRIFTNK